MPLYEYQCDACGKRFEIIQRFSDTAPAACKLCGAGPVQRLPSSPAIQFKGSGFYITDYAKKGADGAGTKAEGGEKSETGAKDAVKSDPGSGQSGTSDATKGDAAKTDKAKGDSSKSDSTTKADTKSASVPPPSKAS